MTALLGSFTFAAFATTLIRRGPITSPAKAQLSRRLPTVRYQGFIRWIRSGAPIHFRAAKVVAGVFGFFVLAIPTAKEFGVVGHTVAFNRIGWDSGLSWFWPWLGCIVVSALAQWSSSGRDIRKWESYALNNAGLLGGFLAQIEQCFRKREDAANDALSEDRITAAILQGLVENVRAFLALPDDVIVSSALLISHRRQPRGGPRQIGLRVCNRNSLQGDRPFTIIPFRDTGPAATCYREKRVVVVEHTRDETYSLLFSGRPYESVVAFPVELVGAGGAGIAVVTIDSTKPFTFTQRMLDEGFGKIVQPYLHLVALARYADQREADHGSTRIENPIDTTGSKERNAAIFPYDLGSES